MTTDRPTPRTDRLFAVKNIGAATKDGIGTNDLYNEFVKMERELAEARELLSKAAAELPRCSGPVHERIQVYFKAYAKELDEAREDAERLNWLDEQCSDGPGGRHIACLKGHLRAAIDAARSKP